MFSYVKPYTGDLHVCCTENTHNRLVTRGMQLITPSHTHKHTHHHCLQEVSSWDPRGDRCVKTTYWFRSSLLWCCFVLLPLKKTTRSDLLCILLMHFSQVTLKTPCSLTLKSNLALPGLKAHVKLKATLGVGMKNWVAPYINQVERSTQHLDRRNGIF